MHAQAESEPTPPQVVAETPSPAEPSPASPRVVVTDPSGPRAATPSTGGAGWVVSLVGCLVVVLGVLWGAYVWRADIIAYWPASARLYSLVGLGEADQ